MLRIMSSIYEPKLPSGHILSGKQLDGFHQTRWGYLNGLVKIQAKEHIQHLRCGRGWWLRDTSNGWAVVFQNS